MTDKRCIEDIDEIKEIKKYFKEEYGELLSNTNTAISIGIDKNNCYTLALRCKIKKGALNHLSETYLGAPLDIQYMGPIIPYGSNI